MKMEIISATRVPPRAGARGMSCEEGEARTHMQDELGSHRLVVTDCVSHVASVAVLGHLEPVALLS